MILGICGSPRNMTTELVLKEALKMLKEKGFETDFFTVSGKRIDFCTHCDYCLKNKECILHDDMRELYPMLGEARGLIMATPVYNGGVSSQIKNIMDRCRPMLAANRKFFRRKIGMAIAVGGDRNGGQELALLQILTFYMLNGITPVSGGFFGANLGATFWSEDTMEGVREDKEGFRSLRKTVKRFTELLEDQSIPKGSPQGDAK